jgi:sugar lactone lactonase YvrE
VPQSRVTAVQPFRAIEGGRITISGTDLLTPDGQAPEVSIGGRPTRVVFASPGAVGVLVPAGVTEGGAAPIRIGGVSGETAFVHVATPFATGLHQVDSPVFDADGNLYVTFSGTRGQQVPVSVFRVGPGGTRATFATGIVNPTSMAIDPEGRIYVSSRFESLVYRLEEDGTAKPFATDLGVACGLAFASDGTLFVGDRSGTIFAVDRQAHATAFATVPASVAAFHLAFGRDGMLYVTAPTLGTHDTLYRIETNGNVTTLPHRFGRPQGLAVDGSGALYVVEALAGASGLYRIPEEGEPELYLTGPGLVGVAFDGKGTLVVCSNETAYRLPAVG